MRSFKKKEMVVYDPRIRILYTVSVLLCISPFTIIFRRHTATETYYRNTNPCNTSKYGLKRIVYGRLPPYMDSVNLELGTYKLSRVITKGKRRISDSCENRRDQVVLLSLR